MSIFTTVKKQNFENFPALPNREIQEKKRWRDHGWEEGALSFFKRD
jgi:hypothetical protein